MIFIYVKTLIMLMPEQARRGPGACRHHVGNPCPRLVSFVDVVAAQAIKMG